MFYTFKIRNKIAVIAITLTLIVSAGMMQLIQNMKVETAVSATEQCLVIDPGHGGIDGGAVAISGAKESDINLSISLRLRELCNLYGIKTIMTRVDDSARTDALSYSEHAELEYRTEVINSAANAVLMSIHQNCYPTSQPSGAQVLYASGSESKFLGELTHNMLLESLQPENRRVAEPAPEKLYITSNAKCPAILIECGFMSNYSDLEKLSDENYQTCISSVLICSYLQYRFLSNHV